MNPGSPVPEPTLVITSLTDAGGPPILLKGFSVLLFSPPLLPILGREPARHGSDLLGISGSVSRGQSSKVSGIGGGQGMEPRFLHDTTSGRGSGSKRGARIPGELMTDYR